MVSGDAYAAPTIIYMNIQMGAVDIRTVCRRDTVEIYSYRKDGVIISQNCHQYQQQKRQQGIDPLSYAGNGKHRFILNDDLMI